MRGSVLPPCGVGIGFKPVHLAAIAERAVPAPAFFEIHAENYLGDGGPPHAALTAIRRDRALSIHAVGLSLGSAPGFDENHARRVKRLIDRYEPALVSDHLSWSASAAGYVHDLLPLPYTDHAFEVIAASIQRCQDILQRQLLIENPSAYLRIKGSYTAETDFLNALCRHTGCGWLLDINNVLVSASNLGASAEDYLAAVDAALVGEIHLAGHAREPFADGDLLIDDHGRAVCDSVWRLYRSFIDRHGARPTLIEWDTDVPTYETLRAEAEIAAGFIADAATGASARDAA